MATLVKDTLFETIFNPRSVAIIGASKSMLSGGGIFLNALMDMGFKGIFPVNPKESELYGLKVYPNVKDIPEPVDYAIVAVQAKIVPQVIRDCVEKGVKVAHIFTAGFGETGEEEGKKLEKEIVDIAKGKTRIIGPNCMGVYCPASRLSYLSGAPKRGGKVSLITQSGRYAVFSVIAADKLGIHFNKAISFGNGCDLESSDFLEYLGDDPDTEVIAMYVEGVKDGKRFLRVADKVGREKPIIIWKGGRTEEGTKAAASHTGSLAGSNLIWECLFKQNGIISVKSMDELLDAISALLNLPAPGGNKIAIVTGGGGETVTSADACADEGLKLMPFNPRTLEQLKSILCMPGTIVRNPLDYSGLGFSPGIVGKVARVVAVDENIDILIVLLFLEPTALKAIMGTSIAQQATPSTSEVMMTMSIAPEPIAAQFDERELLQNFIDVTVSDLIKIKEEIGKPMVLISPVETETQGSMAKLQEKGIPVYPSFERALRAMRHLAEYYDYRAKVQEEMRQATR
jgi:acyl-CoA synthetase (NDP forming)